MLAAKLKLIVVSHISVFVCTLIQSMTYFSRIQQVLECGWGHCSDIVSFVSWVICWQYNFIFLKEGYISLTRWLALRPSACVLSAQFRISQICVSSSGAWQPALSICLHDRWHSCLLLRHLQLKTIVGSISAQPCGHQGTSPGSHFDKYTFENALNIWQVYTKQIIWIYECMSCNMHIRVWPCDDQGKCPGKVQQLLWQVNASAGTT